MTKEHSVIEKSDETNSQFAKNKKLLNRILLFFFMVFLLVSSFGAGLYAGKKNTTVTENKFISFDQAIVSNKENGKGSEVIDFSLYWDVWDLLKEKYVDSKKLDANKLLYGSIKGMLQATGDPYTNFLDPEENKEFNEDITGSFEGIGAELGVKDGILTVIAPLEGAPAEKAGLRAGDKIVKIEEANTPDLSIDQAVKLIRGPKGTKVKLTILRENDEETKEIIVERDVINVKSVKLEMKDNNIAYVKITRFGEDTMAEFNSATKSVNLHDLKGIVLDLRNNPGGYLDVAVNLASKMLPGGKVVVIEEDSAGKQKSIRSRGGDYLSDFYTVVLINEGSASASEILAGALRDNRDNVTILGEQSFGKGSVQELITLSQNTAAKITIAKWLTPKGEQINNQGIKPDTEIKFTEDDFRNNKDPQLDKALEILKEKIK